MKTQAKQAISWSAGKRGQTKVRFALVLNLIGWESGASFLYQSQTKAKTKAVLDYCRQPTENCSITQFFPNHCWVHWGLLNWTTKKNHKLTWNPVIISSFLFILCSLKRRDEKTHCFQNALGEENTKKILYTDSTKHSNEQENSDPWHKVYQQWLKILLLAPTNVRPFWENTVLL